MTRSPALMPPTSPPTCATSPANSMPTMVPAPPTLPWLRPAATVRSARLRPLTRTRTSTSFGFGTGAGVSRTCTPSSVTIAAFMSGILSRRVRVLAAQLWRRRAGQPFLCVLQTGIPCPLALEVVLHAHAQPSESLGLELDPVAVLEAAEAAMVGSRRQNVPRLEGMDRTHPLDAARDLVRHVAGVEILLQLAVHPQPDLQVLRVGSLVRGHDVRPHRRERRPGFHLVEGIPGRQQAARRAIDEVHVAEHVAHRIGGPNVECMPADDNRDFRLALEDGCRNVRQHHGVAVAYDGVRGLVEGVD